MTDAFITGICTMGATLIGAVSTAIVSIYSLKRSSMTQRQQRMVKEILDDLSNFHELEEEYIKKLIEARNKNGDKNFVTHDAIVREIRKALRERNVDFDCSPSDITWYKKTINLADV